MLYLNRQEQDKPHVINTPEDKRSNNYKGLLSRTHINQNSDTGVIESLHIDPIKWDDTNYILTTKNNRKEPALMGLLNLLNIIRRTLNQNFLVFWIGAGWHTLVESLCM